MICTRNFFEKYGVLKQLYYNYFFLVPVHFISSSIINYLV